MFYITQFSDLKIDREKIESLVEKNQDLGWNRENFETLASSTFLQIVFHFFDKNPF